MSIRATLLGFVNKPHESALSVAPDRLYTNFISGMTLHEDTCALYVSSLTTGEIFVYNTATNELEGTLHTVLNELVDSEMRA